MKFLKLSVWDLRTGECVLRDREFRDDVVVFGRSADVQCTLPEKSNEEVSRRHGQFARNGANSFLVLDKSSLGKTWLNQRHLRQGQPVPVHDGDEVFVGEQRWRIDVRLVDAAPAAGFEAPRPIEPEPPRPEPTPTPRDLTPRVETPPRPVPVRPEPVRPEPVRPEPVRPEPVRPQPLPPDPELRAVVAAPSDPIQPLVDGIRARLAEQYAASRDLHRDVRRRQLAETLREFVLTLEPRDKPQVLARLRSGFAHALPVAAPPPVFEPEPTGDLHTAGVDELAARVLGAAPADDAARADFLDRIERSLRSLVEGLVRLHVQRRDFNDGLGTASETMMGRSGQNPLLIRLDTPSVLRALLGRGLAGDPDRADQLLRNAIGRIERHIAGLVAISREAPRVTLAEIDPDDIEKENKVLVGPLGAMRWWKSFRELHEELLTNAGGLFDRIWPELSLAYSREQHPRSRQDDSGRAE
ncbi:MAG: FHA domain-containing protein [Planctomycetes bacterium]|nr:FHA domain-containing protein [Planctomycetota bacterium]